MDARTLEPTVVEDPAYLSAQLITCIGNKRGLLSLIAQGLEVVRRECDQPLVMLDAFAGSGVVSRFFKRFARRLVSNDLETYAQFIARGYLANRADVDWPALEAAHREIVQQARAHPVTDGIIRRHYSPRDDRDIQPGERAFYTTQNAIRLDTYRQLIARQSPELQPLLLAPLLAKASVHANTSGVFKGFYKDRDGVGCFGGHGGDALYRIKGAIELELPVLSRCRCEVEVHGQDANQLVRQIGPVDVAYFDPPYNQHPYGSNYFMLNLLCDYTEPRDPSPVSGIPRGWKRSAYNRRAAAVQAMKQLVEATDARWFLVSYNDEGFIPPDEMCALLRSRGEVQTLRMRYNTFRGSRNLSRRALHVNELLYVVQCSG